VRDVVVRMAGCRRAPAVALTRVRCEVLTVVMVVLRVDQPVETVELGGLGVCFTAHAV